MGMGDKCHPTAGRLCSRLLKAEDDVVLLMAVSPGPNAVRHLIRIYGMSEECYMQAVKINLGFIIIKTRILKINIIDCLRCYPKDKYLKMCRIIT